MTNSDYYLKTICEEDQVLVSSMGRRYVKRGERKIVYEDLNNLYGGACLNTYQLEIFVK